MTPDKYAEAFGLICDVVERTYQGWPLDRQRDEAPVLHTSDEAREATARIFEILGVEPTFFPANSAAEALAAKGRDGYQRRSAAGWCGVSDDPIVPLPGFLAREILKPLESTRPLSAEAIKESVDETRRKTSPVWIPIALVTVQAALDAMLVDGRVEPAPQHFEYVDAEPARYFIGPIIGVAWLEAHP